VDSTLSPVLTQAQPAPRTSRWKRLARQFNAIFVVTVVLPTALAAAYYGLIASDVYISESRFVVKSPQRQTQTGLSALLQGTGFSRSQDDTYSVHDFVLSRDALHELDQKLKLHAAFSNSDIDVFNRFPGIGRDGSFEAFHNYYLKHALINYDPTSSISVLRVRAFTAQDSQRINEMLLEMGEHLVNTLNQRGRQDLIEVAQQEVKMAEAKAMAAALALSGFRADRSVFDPAGQSALQLQSVTKLEQELISTEAQLSEIKRVSPRNPQIGSLVARADGLRKVIAAETAKVTGGGRASLSAKTPTYDRLTLERTFADRQLGSALAALETARGEAARKQLYLERLVQPSLPDSSMEPRRLRSVITVFLLGLVAWGVGSLLVASIREHAD